jgi:hypothetical protein
MTVPATVALARRQRYAGRMARQDERDEGTTRAARLKAALRANLAKRKAQARATKADADSSPAAGASGTATAREA